MLCHGQVIVLIGSSASAVDICRDIAGVAKEVHVASRSVADETYEKQPGYDNMWLHSMVKIFEIAITSIILKFSLSWYWEMDG